MFTAVVNLDVLDNTFDHIEGDDILPQSDILDGTIGEELFAPSRTIFFLLFAGKQHLSEYALIQVGIESYCKPDAKGIVARASITRSYNDKVNKAI